MSYNKVTIINKINDILFEYQKTRNQTNPFMQKEMIQKVSGGYRAAAQTFFTHTLKYQNDNFTTGMEKIISYVQSRRGSDFYLFSREELSEIKDLLEKETDILSREPGGLDLINKLIKLQEFYDSLSRYIGKKYRDFSGYQDQIYSHNSRVLNSHQLMFLNKIGNSNDEKTKKRWIGKPDDSNKFYENQKYIEVASGNIYRFYIGKLMPKYKIIKNGNKYVVLSKEVDGFSDNSTTINEYIYNYTTKKPKNLAKILLTSMLLAENDLKIGNLALTKNSSGSFDFIKIDHDQSFYPLISTRRNQNFVIDSGDLNELPFILKYDAYNFFYRGTNDFRRSKDLYTKISKDNVFLAEKHKCISKIIFSHPKIIFTIISNSENVDIDVKMSMKDFFLERYNKFCSAAREAESYKQYCKNELQIKKDLEETKKEVEEFFSENPKIRKELHLSGLISWVDEAYIAFKRKKIISC
ncbi:MAG: hypothetical protein K2X39_09445 [Silvanigrellaceae bacterium]|nr:hypothetical protein [Silvanigrellaceae bacterium]